MDLMQVWQIVIRRGGLLITGMLVGVILVFLSLYRVDLSPPGSSAPIVDLEPRSLTDYRTIVNLVVDAPGFGLGRTDVDIGRGVALASTYSYLVTSDPVMQRVEEQLGRPLRASATGRWVDKSPVFQVIVQGNDPEYIRKLAGAAAGEFVGYLRDSQTGNNVPADKRVVVRTLGPASPPEPIKSRKFEIALILFLASLAATGGLMLALENIEQSRIRMREDEIEAIARKRAATDLSAAHVPSSLGRQVPGGQPPGTGPNPAARASGDPPSQASGDEDRKTTGAGKPGRSGGGWRAG